MNIDELVDLGIDSEIVSKLKAKGLIKLTEAQTKAVQEGLCDGENLAISARTSFSLSAKVPC